MVEESRSENLMKSLLSLFGRLSIYYLRTFDVKVEMAVNLLLADLGVRLKTFVDLLSASL